MIDNGSFKKKKVNIIVATNNWSCYLPMVQLLNGHPSKYWASSILLNFVDLAKNR